MWMRTSPRPDTSSCSKKTRFAQTYDNRHLSRRGRGVWANRLVSWVTPRRCRRSKNDHSKRCTRSLLGHRGFLGEAMSDPLTNVRRVINSFVAQQRRGRVLVGVDDAHLLDGLSALVVHQLAQCGGARLPVTGRTGSEEPDAVTALWKDGLLARLDLQPLSAVATREVIESTLGGPVDARSAA